jgi:hypothetical protein
MIVADRGIGRISQFRGIHRIAKDLANTTLFGYDCDGVSFVSVNPNISGDIERYAIPALEYGMSHKNIAQAKRVSCECGIASGSACKGSIWVEFRMLEVDFPKRTARCVNDKYRIAALVESDTVCDKILCGAGWNSSISTSDARTRHSPTQADAVIHGLNAKHFDC